MKESALYLNRGSQTALLGEVLLHWSQCSRMELERRNWSSEVPSCVSFHTSLCSGTNKSQLSGMRSRSFSYVSSNATCTSQADACFQGWNWTIGKAAVSHRNVKKPQKLTSAAMGCLRRSPLVPYWWNLLPIRKVCKTWDPYTRNTEQERSL